MVSSTHLQTPAHPTSYLHQKFQTTFLQLIARPLEANTLFAPVPISASRFLHRLERPFCGSASLYEFLSPRIATDHCKTDRYSTYAFKYGRLCHYWYHFIFELCCRFCISRYHSEFCVFTRGPPRARPTEQHHGQSERSSTSNLRLGSPLTVSTFLAERHSTLSPIRYR